MENYEERIKTSLEQEPLSGFGLKYVGVGADKVVFETAGSQGARI